LLTISDAPARAYMNWGLWVAECPQAWCNGVDHYGPGPNTGRIGGLGERTFRCPRCGHETDAVWPEAADDITALLAQRPMVENRNWLLGETVDQLLRENINHGILPPTLEPGTGLRIINGRFEDRTVLAGATLRAIGA
jgi:hypothetical protein